MVQALEIILLVAKIKEMIMRKIYFLFMLVLSFSAHGVEFSPGVFVQENEKHPNSSTTLGETNLGIIFTMTAGDKFKYGADIYSTFVDGSTSKGIEGINNKLHGFAVKAGYAFGDFDFYLGLGSVREQVKGEMSGFTETVDYNFDTSPLTFIEVKHSSGIYVKYSEYTLDNTFVFRNLVGGVWVPGGQYSTSVDRKIWSLGYRYSFDL